jgi:RNA polymerase sigma factor (sigma-70 family)
VPPLRTDLSDSALIERTRGGDRAAYGELWQRHAASARTVARSYSSLDPDDLVAESFTKIYDAILGGGGPTSAFRPYLFTTLRNTASSWGRDRRETNLETLESFEDPETSESATLDSLDRSTTAQAFRSLPTRWQEVLWYSEVEGMHPQQVAPLVGMSANATAALAYRAREGLRQAWIQAHLRNAADEPECRWTIDRLGSYTRGRLRTRDTAKLEAHLDDCARCTIVAAEAREVGSRLALVLLPLTAGVGGATAYSAWLSQGAPAVHAMGAAGLPSVLVGVPAAAGTAASGGAGAGSASIGAAASGASGSLGASGVAVGAGVGVLVLAAAAIAVVVTVSNLAEVNEAPPAAAAVAGAEPVKLPEFTGPVLPEPVPPSPHVPIAPDEPEDTAGFDEVDAVDAVVLNPSPTPSPVPPPMLAPVPQPEPVDVVALAPSFTADTAGGLVDPLLSGTAEAGASIVVTAADGRSWTTLADPTGAWSLTANDLPAGTTVLTAAQTDAAGNTSPASAPVAVELSVPSLELRTSGPLVWHLTFTGVPDSTVEVLLDGAALASITLDGSGSAKYIGHDWSGVLADLEVRYTAVGRTGPTTAAAFVDAG